MEIWKDIKGYEGLYQASNAGIVKSLKSGRWRNKIKILKGGDNGYGYLKVDLCKDKIKKTTYIHYIITDTFLGTRPCGLDINHKNGIKTDNRVENLEYCTRSENNKHKFQVLGHNRYFGINIGKGN